MEITRKELKGVFKEIIFEQRVFTVQEVAKILRIGENGAYALIHAGYIKSLQLNGWKITSKELDRFLEENLCVEINTKELEDAKKEQKNAAKIRRIRLEISRAIVDLGQDLDDIYPGKLVIAAEWKSPERRQANSGQIKTNK